ncbi:uncharacterized protein LOC116774513 [Danaus plexippus]|uniref:uncharacterized protein LOC116774513 n=1 Tax=Danaus plexippus TaxID=13037 RepID=UPI002AB28322|nr:uncharacterized protein LOC116774513 [Danaus plexippus]
MFLLILLLYTLPHIQGRYVISVYGDVYHDREFFSRVFPWIIDNIGGDISVDYYLLGSGRYSVPQICALNEMKMNIFLQAQYLKCEAEGNPSDKCLCETGIDPEKYRICVQNKGSYAGISSAKFSQLGLDISPVIEIGYRNTIFGVEDSWYLKKICTIFGDNPPRGCVKPFSCNNTNIESDRKGLAVYNCEKCHTSVAVERSIELLIKNEDGHTTTTKPTELSYTTDYSRTDFDYEI